MTFLSRAIQDYHRILEEHERAVVDSHGELIADLKHAKLTYGGRVMTPFLRPQLVTRTQVRMLVGLCHLLRRAFTKAKEALLSDPGLFEELGFTDAERDLVRIEPRLKSVGVTARLDSFLCGESVRFVELNCEVPAGPGYTDLTNEIFLGYWPMRKFMKTYKLDTFNVTQRLGDVLLQNWRLWGGTSIPTVAITDWKDVSTRTEFDIIADRFNARGIPTFFCDPRDLSFDGKKLSFEGRQIDVIYRRVVTNEFLEKIDDCKAMLEAYRTNSVCMINTFRSKLLHKKIIFAILHDPRVTRLYTPEEHEVVRSVIPWTATIREGRVQREGREVDLIPFVQKNRQSLVLKPNDEYGGRGVVVGNQVGPGDWDEALRAGLKASTVVQEAVSIPSEEFPEIVDGRLSFGRKYIDLDPYLFHGDMGGILTRLSGTPKINVTAGGGMVPTFVIDDGQA